MNKITKLKGMISTIKSSSIYAQDPESFSANLSILYRDLEAEMEKAKARRIARKSRKSTQATPFPAFPTLNGVPFQPFATGTMGTKTSATRFDLEVKLFAQQVMREQGLKAELKITTCRTSRAQLRIRGGSRSLRVIFGSQSIDRAATRGFSEYQQCKPYIMRYKTTGLSGVRLLVLHELAHIAQYTNNSGRTQSHGREFLTEYNMLLNKYQSALELK